MKAFQYIITDEIGIHARPAGLLVKEAGKYHSRIMLSGNGKDADAGKLMAVMCMGIREGMSVTVTAEGPDEEQAIEAMKRFFRENL